MSCLKWISHEKKLDKVSKRATDHDITLPKWSLPSSLRKIKPPFYSIMNSQLMSLPGKETNLKEVNTLCGRPEDSYSSQICWARCESFAFTHALRRKSRLVRETFSPSSLTARRSSIPTSKFTGSISHIWQNTFRSVHTSKQKVKLKREINLKRFWFMKKKVFRNNYNLYSHVFLPATNTVKQFNR